MTFPIPPQIWAERPNTSIWTDFTNAYNGETLIGSYPVGALMADWSHPSGSPDIAAVAVHPGAISGQAFRHADSTSTGRNTVFLWGYAGLSAVLDFDVLLGVLVVSTQDGGELAVPQGGNIVARRGSIEAGSHSVQGLGLTGAANLRDRAEISESSPAGFVSSTPTMPFLWDLSRWYWQRFRGEGGEYMLRRWPRGEPEPTVWHNTLSGGALLTPGQVGIYASNRGHAEQYFDFFSVSLDGRPAYGPDL